MEHLNRLFVNYIIYNLQQIGIAVKPDEQVLFRIVILNVVIPPVQDCMADILPSNAMFEGGRHKLNADFHIPILPQKRRWRQHSGRARVHFQIRGKSIQ
jgi:hypothetical protein